MAAVASTAVTIDASYNSVGFYGGKRRHVQATLVLSTQGSVANPIPASVFGLQKIEEVHSVRSSADLIYVAAPSYDGSSADLCLVNGATGAPADATATVRMIVVGPEAVQ